MRPPTLDGATGTFRVESDARSTARGAGQGSAIGEAGALRASLTSAAIGADAGHRLLAAGLPRGGLQAMLPDGTPPRSGLDATACATAAGPGSELSRGRHQRCLGGTASNHRLAPA